MKIILYKFQKRVNATNDPSVSTTVEKIEVDAKLKSDASILSPVIEFSDDYTEYTYMYIEKFKRYYYIEDWTQTFLRWVASCVVDVLASHKAGILNTNAFVLRTSNQTKIDRSIIDEQYPIQAGVDIRQLSFDLDDFDITSDPTDNKGWFVVGFVNGISQLGAVSYFLMKEAAFYSIITKLVNTNPLGITAYLNSKANLLQYIYSAYWTPIDIPSVDPSCVQELTSGDIPIFITTDGDGGIDVHIDTSTQGKVYYIKDAKPLEFSSNILITDDLISNDDPLWMRLNEFKYTLYIPWFSTVEIDPGLIGNMSPNTTISVRLKVDTTNGDAVCVISKRSSYSEFFEDAACIKAGRFGVDLAIAQRGNNIADVIMQAGTNAISGISSAVSQSYANAKIGDFNYLIKETRKARSEKSIGKKKAAKKIHEYYDEKESLEEITGFDIGAGSSMINAASAAMNLNMETVVRGGASTWTEAGNSKLIFTVYRKTRNADETQFGAPCFQFGRLQEHVGEYVVATNAFITTPMTDTEKNEIVKLLAGGVYLT